MDEDEIFADEDEYDDADMKMNSFESMLNEMYEENEEIEETPTHETCGAGPIPDVQMPQLAPFGVPSIAGVPEIPDMDPNVFVNIFFKVMEILEDKVNEAMVVNEVGVCYAIPPIEIFVNKTPYLIYEELLMESEGQEALRKLEQLKAEVRSKIPGV